MPVASRFRRFFSSNPIALKLLRFLPLMLIAAGCASPAVFQNPDITEVDQSVESLSFEEVRFYHIFDVRNAQAYVAELQTVSYSVTVGERVITDGVLEPGLRVDAGDIEALTVPLRVNYAQLQNQIGSFPERENLPYALEVIVTSASVPEQADQSPATAIDTLSFSGDFPLLQEPRLFVDTLMIKSFNLAIAELEMRVRLVNPNAVPITFNTGSYALEVDGATWHNQSISQNITIPAQSDVVLDTPFSMRPREFNTQVYRMLNMEQPFDYTVTGSFGIRVSHPSFMRAHTWSFSRPGNHQFPRL